MSWLTFRHEAMATYFEVALADAEPRYAAQAAAAVFREIDRLERELSRFVESSDVSRINRLARGETTTVGEDAFECLLIAADICLASHGAFDSAYGSDVAAVSPRSSEDTRKLQPPQPAPIGTSSEGACRPADGDLPFHLDPTTHAVTSRASRLRVDLGAIGKGYALDVGAALAREWQLPCACLVAGGSSVVALDPPPGQLGWEIGVGDEPRVQRVSLRNVAISASGTAVQGSHIVDPRTGRPAVRNTRTWALASAGAQSDALSTAFFVMTDEEIEGFCRGHPEIGAAVTLPDGTLRTCGAMARLLA